MIPRYSLICARDGQLIEETSRQPDLAMAQAWAAGLIAALFRLDPELFPMFEDVVPETDACRLVEVKPDPIVHAAMDLVSVISAPPTLITAAFRAMDETRSARLVKCVADLRAALEAAGHRS